MANKRGRLGVGQGVEVADVSGLTQAGLKLLIALSDHDPDSETVTELCKRADISRDSYCRLMRDSNFQHFMRKFAQADIFSFIPKLIRTLIKGASKGDPKMMRMCLQIAGLTPDSKPIDSEQKPEKPLSDDEQMDRLNDAIAELEKKGNVVDIKKKD